MGVLWGLAAKQLGVQDETRMPTMSTTCFQIFQLQILDPRLCSFAIVTEAAVNLSESEFNVGKAALLKPKKISKRFPAFARPLS